MAEKKIENKRMGCRKRKRGSWWCPKPENSDTPNPREFYSISLESFCSKVRSVTWEPSPNSNCSVPICSANLGSERQGQNKTHWRGKKSSLRQARKHTGLYCNFIKVRSHEQLSWRLKWILSSKAKMLSLFPHTSIRGGISPFPEWIKGSKSSPFCLSRYSWRGQNEFGHWKDGFNQILFKIRIFPFVHNQQ